MNKRGFTLLELLVVMGFMLALSSIALVVYKGMMSGTAMGSAITHLDQTLQLARQTAIMQGRGVYVVFCQSTSEVWYVTCRKEGVVTGGGGYFLGDMFNAEIEKIAVGTPIYNLSKSTAIFSPVTGTGPNLLTTTNSIWQVNDVYGWEIRKKMRLPLKFRFKEDEVPETVRFNPDGTVCRYDGTMFPGGAATFKVYEKTRPGIYAMLTLDMMGRTSYTY